MALIVNINSWLKKAIAGRISEIVPEAEIGADWVHMPDYEGADKGTWQRRRYIKIYDRRSKSNGLIHYEYLGGYVCLHIEGKYAGKDYIRQSRELKRISRNHDDLIWRLSPDAKCISCMISEEVSDVNDLIGKFRRMADIFDSSLKRLYEDDASAPVDLQGEYVPKSQGIATKLSDDEVSIREAGISDVFDLALSIPDYQRIYCWENKEIETLWHSLSSIKKEMPYHLGTLILQFREGRYEIVDGQQRLVTLSLILRGLGYDRNIPLLNERFRNDDAIRHISNTKAVVNALLRNRRNEDMLDTIVSSLKFSVIIINGDNLDLGYTFFSNQNSKGVKLTDYDLLKAHHLRYIVSESQAIHLAKGWIKLTQKDENSAMPVERSLGRHIYRMRKLLRKDNFDEYGHYVRDEFRSAPIMEDVPPFGERFDFFEPIQGGPHFFAFAAHFNDRYKTFSTLCQVKLLNEKFGRRHGVYRDLAETILFGYYLKFGTQYLSEALFCIISKLAEHRYRSVRALAPQVQRYAIESGLIQFIQFSTSPTFFLASATDCIQTEYTDYDINDGIRRDFYIRMCELFTALDDITVADIIKRIENEYQ